MKCLQEYMNRIENVHVDHFTTLLTHHWALHQKLAVLALGRGPEYMGLEGTAPVDMGLEGMAFVGRASEGMVQEQTLVPPGENPAGHTVLVLGKTVLLEPGCSLVEAFQTRQAGVARRHYCEWVCSPPLQGSRSSPVTCRLPSHLPCCIKETNKNVDRFNKLNE